MRRSVAMVLVFGALLATAGAQEASDCPSRRVISSGVCVGKDGNDCSKREREALVCYDANPQYTDEAAKANIKGLVRLLATVGADGCAREIKVVSSLGYGLDEAAISALERFRFHKWPKPVRVNVEFNFDPQLSSRRPVTAPKCGELGDRSSGKK